MPGEQLADDCLPGLQLRFLPRAVILAGARLLERILDAAADRTVFMAAPDVLGVVRHRGPRMAVPDPAAPDPQIADIARRIGVEHDRPGVHLGAHPENLLLLGIVPLDDTGALVGRPAAGHAAAPDILREHG